MSLQNRIYLQNIQGIKEQSEDVHEAHGHEGQSCEEAHPDMSHDEYMDEKEDEQGEEQNEQSDDCSCDGEEKGVCTCDEKELDEQKLMSEAMLVLKEKSAQPMDKNRPFNVPTKPRYDYREYYLPNGEKNPDYVPLGDRPIGSSE
tara:strand:- start:1220 stop:1654 length:435 start_codon:yes stop_codon:yes gene_type:complete